MSIVPSQGSTRCGYVAIIGAPNAGKSTLINALVGGKISIVSPKVQTTRTRVLGITVKDEAQIIFVDTPGLFRPSDKNRMERAIVAAAKEGMTHADGLIFVVDAAKGYTPDVKAIAADLQAVAAGKPVYLALNKIDACSRDKLLSLAAAINADHPYTATFMISALSGDGVADLLTTIAKTLPQGPWLYPEDQMAEMPMRLMAAEITREKLFHHLHQEIPYSLTVETENWESHADGSVKISQIIYIAREGQKKIVIGHKGSMLKTVGQESRRDLEDILEGRVHLSLFVKVRERWLDDKEHYTLWGLDPNV